MVAEQAAVRGHPDQAMQEHDLAADGERLTEWAQSRIEARDRVAGTQCRTEREPAVLDDPDRGVAVRVHGDLVHLAGGKHGRQDRQDLRTARLRRRGVVVHGAAMQGALERGSGMR